MKDNDIRTNRLIIKAVTLDDTAFLADLWNDPEVGRYLNVPPYKNVGELEDILEDMRTWNDEYSFIAYDIELDHKIGTCSVAADGPKGYWGFSYDVSRKFWGKGYATEMANAMIDFIYSLGARDLYCIVAKENLASRRVMDKCGLKETSITNYENPRTRVVYDAIIYRMHLE